MRQKDRQDIIPPAGDCDGPGDNLDRLRQQANSFLAAGDEAIDRALANSDSVTFLRANQQQGGE